MPYRAMEMGCCRRRMTKGLKGIDPGTVISDHVAQIFVRRIKRSVSWSLRPPCMLHRDGITPDDPAAAEVKASPTFSGGNNSCSHPLKAWECLSSSKSSQGSCSPSGDRPDNLRRTLISVTNEKAGNSAEANSGVQFKPS